MVFWKNQIFTCSNAFPDGLHELFHSNSNGVFFNNNSSENGTFEWMAGFSNSNPVESSENNNPFFEIQNFLKQKNDWAFGHFNYDLKNSIENLHSEHASGIEFPTFSFFTPDLIAIKTFESLKIGSMHEIAENVFQKLQHAKKEKTIISSKINIKDRTSKEEYIQNVNSILEHIHRGDIYEINYCIEFFAKDVIIDPISVFEKLNELTEAPFSVLYKNEEQWLICASPERFIQKKGSKIISQPIKGTRPRGKTTVEDDFFRNELLQCKKERSENVMIVDLVRNDLSKSAKKGTVKVDELFGIHSFKNVHQMISTVSCELDKEVNPIEAIKNAFPMGSMTGAPKVRAMELIEELENRKRGLYSGAVGYFTPEMDFDFNVVIRSIQYNSKTGYLSLMVGSAITANSDPEKEYAECLLKAETLFQALGVKIEDF